MSELCDANFVHHPFDNEDEVSLRHLYKSLWNHVTLGQWELARVCLGKLYRARTLLKKPLKDVLRAVIDRPTFVGYVLFVIVIVFLWHFCFTFK